MKILILADSRGRNLEHELDMLLDCRFRVEFYPGADISETINRASFTISSHRWSQIYVLSGICDLTTKDKSTKIVTLRHASPTLALNHYLSTVNAARIKIASYLPPGTSESKCIFAPVTGINLSTYNSHVSNSSTIVESQNQLNHTIELINSEIFRINNHHKAHTPWTSRIIHKQSRRSFSHHYDKLASDGCHFSPPVLRHRADAIHVSILKNSS